MKTYCIEPTYTHRDEVPYFDDTPFKDEFQPEVYEYAERVADGLRPHTVIDLGCGSGFKLMKHFAHLHTIGIDLQPTINFCRHIYPDRLWVVSGSPIRYVRPALMVCSDVIEHVEDPDTLLDYVDTIRPDRMVFSTPDRLEIPLAIKEGPPRNIHHFREWTHDEFVAYLAQRYTVIDSVRGLTTIVKVRNKP